MGKAIRANKVRQYSDSDIKKIKKTYYEKGAHALMIVFFTVMCDKEGWGYKRLQRVFDNVQTLTNAMAEGRVDLHDLKRVLADEKQIYIEL